MRIFEFKPPENHQEPKLATRQRVNITPRQKQAAAASGLIFIGLVIGLIYAWLINPVVWTNVPYAWLGESEKTAIIYAMSDLSAYDLDSNRLTAITHKWPEIDLDICLLASNEPDMAQRIRLIGLAYRVNGGGCE